MKKYSYMNVVAFKDKKTGTVIITREYKNDDEYFEIMDSIDGNAWEMIFDKITRYFVTHPAPEVTRAEKKIIFYRR